MRRIVSGVLVGMLAATTLVVSSTSAQAASCVISKYVNYTQDYARTTDVSGGCSVVKVGHYFNPGGISSSIYTGTFSHPDVVTTGRAAELSSSYHAGS
jgi:hypothetical protein